jgi:hypothetical protein
MYLIIGLRCIYVYTSWEDRIDNETCCTMESASSRSVRLLHSYMLTGEQPVLPAEGGLSVGTGHQSLATE